MVLCADFQANITLLSEQFQSSNVLVTLEWIQRDFYSYNVSTIPKLEHEVEYKISGVRLNVSYNTFYNVNVMAIPPCQQNHNNMSNFIGLYYGKYDWV